MIVGVGATGMSCARYLSRKGLEFAAVDTRLKPPSLQEWKNQFPDVPVSLGELDVPLLEEADELIVSPGLDLRLPPLKRLRERGVLISNDVELFYREARAPIVAITGTNAKSTVTSLVGQMVRAAGVNAAVGGNLGTPVLDLLADDVAFYVLELSSFQLDLVDSFRADVAAFLNFSPDHLDRYGSVEDYRNSKRRVYLNAGHIVFNRDDKATWPPPGSALPCTSFGHDEPHGNEFGVKATGGKFWLARDDERLIEVSSLRRNDSTDQANALAALAIVHAAGVELDQTLAALRGFTGLAHRRQEVATIDGIRFVDDSKATNVGAAAASILSLADNRKRIVLIAGGIAKERDFSPLMNALARYGRAVVLIGDAAGELRKALEPAVPAIRCNGMDQAVKEARRRSRHGDIVLLAPACASFDMYRDYAERGQEFVKAVERIGGSLSDA